MKTWAITTVLAQPSRGELPAKSLESSKTMLYNNQISGCNRLEESNHVWQKNVTFSNKQKTSYPNNPTSAANTIKW